MGGRESTKNGWRSPKNSLRGNISKMVLEITIIMRYAHCRQLYVRELRNKRSK